MKISLVYFLVLCLSASFCPQVAAEDSSAYEDIQMLKGDLHTISTSALQRVSITDPDIADIVDVKPEEVTLSALHPGQTVLFLWDMSGKHSYFIQVLAEDLGIVRERIAAILAKSGITGVKIERNDLEGKIILSGGVPEDKVELVASAADYFPGIVLNLVKKEDIQDMVQIDMQITELSTTLDKAMGVDWFTVAGTGTTKSNLTFSAATAGEQTKVRHPFDLFNVGSFFQANQINAAVHALLSEGKATILSKPKLMVKSGHEATLQVGGEIPIKTVTNAPGSTTLTENVTFKPYGISMSIIPTISGNGNIDIEVSTEISDLDSATAQTISQDVALLTRSATTQVMLRDGQTTVFAGLIKKNRSETTNKVPFLSKIPFIGSKLFTYKFTPAADKDTEVVISLTPTIVKTGARAPVNSLDTAAADVQVPALSQDDQLVMDTDRRNNRMPIIARNAASMPVTIPRNLKPYAESVQQRISAGIAYPYEARDKRWQGTVKLGMVIRKDGSLRDVFVKQSSGYDVFDRDAVSTAQTLAPYSHFPEGITSDEITITLPIVYSLDSLLKTANRTDSKI